MLNTKKYGLIFIIILSHITLLDFFFITHNGPVFLIEESLQTDTIITHLLIAFSTTAIGFITHKITKNYQTKKFKIRDKTLILGCFFMFIAILYVLLEM